MADHSIAAIRLHGDGEYIVVSVETEGRPGEWVEIAREHSGHPEVVAISHIVERSGIAKAIRERP